MPSTFPSTIKPPNEDDRKATTLRWRTWPLVDHARWSWLPLAGCAAVGGTVAYLSESWLLGFAGAAGLAATLWQYFVPTHYEIGSQGLRRTALGRSRLVPWHAIRAHQLRTNGVIFYQRPNPTTLDLIRGVFLPFPANEDDVICSLRQNLSHTVELST
jgi:hypothetical protein